MSNIIDNTQDTINSRDIIERIEELETEMMDAKGDWDGVSGLDMPKELAEWEKENAKELDDLRALRDEAEGYGDWEYGETLIREDYFTDYIEELINECYEMPKEMNSGNWPYRHMSIDYEAAAEEAKADYTELDFDGVTYLMRAR